MQYAPPPSSTSSQETNPALYTSPLVNLLKYMTRKFSHHPNPQQPSEEYMTSAEGVSEGGQGEDGERDLPLPQARIQDNPSFQGGHHHHHSRPHGSRSRQSQQGNNGAHFGQNFGNSDGEPGNGASASAYEGNGASFTNHFDGYGHHQQHQNRPSANNNYLGASPFNLDPHAMSSSSSFSNPQQTPEANENRRRMSTNNVHVLQQPESPRGRTFRVGPLMDDEAIWQMASDV